MYQALLVIYLLVSIALIGFVLIQQGKGANAGASFGGASGTVFGSSGAGNFLTRTTAILAAIFFIINLAIANINSHHNNVTGSKFDNLSQVAEKIEQQQPVKVESKQNSDIPQ
ncbi:preprotein translocase subunit SecG [Avibacterium paragallinarum]|uniref:preprotein translocase subunit SecG n=1 Tax=Avibacterium paragallinarum TaxID=728 RepID=UPI003978BC4B